MKQFIVAANWKMQRPFKETIQWCTTHKDALASLSKKTESELILCPDFVALHPVRQLLHNTSVRLGAQDCSEYDHGAYTGQVSAQSLADVECTYCIIGHSERRQYSTESNESIARKMEQLIKNNIQPIVCVGETKNEYEQKETFSILQKQLEPLFTAAEKNPPHTVCIAYEPVWAIGTGLVPEPAYLTTVFEWLDKNCSKICDSAGLRLLYGGSVSETTAASIKSIPHVEGFLVGGASLDFQKFKNIVLL